MLDSRKTRCPWCGERFEVLIDASEGQTDYVEDCPVCCRPISMHVEVDGDGEVSGFGSERE
jgi:hypothetical protein